MERAVSPVVGVVLLVGVAVLAATAVGVGALALDAPADPAHLAISVAVDADRNRVAVTPRAGATVSVDRLDVRIAIDGRPLVHQPPVQFFVARGFRAGPTGPFNRGAAPTWTAGERASLRIAGTNDPVPEPGDAVRVTIRRNGTRLGTASATAL